MQESRALEPDVDEGGLQAGFDRGDLPLVDVADDALGIRALDQQFHEFAVFEHGDADLVGGRVDDDFFAHITCLRRAGPLTR